MLVDRFGRKHTYLRISLTDRCNLRCSYCMPQEKMDFLPYRSVMTAEEILSMARIFVDAGITKIRLTGGEPLVRKDAAEILLALSDLSVTLTLTTNAVRTPAFIPIFKQARIQCLNVSLDTLKADRFEQLTRRNRFTQVWANIVQLMEEGFQVKLNVVVVRGINDHEVPDFVALTKDWPLEVRFIEYMPFPGNGWTKSQVVGMQELLDVLQPFFPFAPLPHEAHATAKLFSVPDFRGQFGMITTVTQPFCSDCNRLRITADGKIKHCLFSKGEIDLLSALRSNEPLGPLVQAALFQKAAQTGGQSFSEPTQNRPMISIGG